MIRLLEEPWVVAAVRALITNRKQIRRYLPYEKTLDMIVCLPSMQATDRMAM